MRQYHQLTDGELSDLADVLVRALVVELGKLEVAGADRADHWELADELRHTITDHHAHAFRRYLAQQLESNP